MYTVVILISKSICIESLDDSYCIYIPYYFWGMMNAPVKRKFDRGCTIIILLTHLQTCIYLK